MDNPKRRAPPARTPGGDQLTACATASGPWVGTPEPMPDANTVEHGLWLVGSLKSKVVHAGLWTLGGHFLSLVLRLGGSLALTRIFAPEVFGLLALATAALVLVTLLSDIGLRQAVIRSPNGTNQLFLNTAWTLQVARGGLIWVLCVIGAGVLREAASRGWVPAGSVYLDPALPAVIAATSFSAVILGFFSMKAVTAHRDLDLKRLTLMELLSQCAALVVTLVSGFATRSIWAFVAGSLVGSTLTALLSHFWFRGPADGFAWNREALSELRNFGKWSFVSSAFTALAINGDRLLLGGWLNPAMLGYYSLASNLAMVGQDVANRLFGSVTLPAFSQVVRQQPYRLRAVYAQFRWTLDTMLVGGAGFLFATGGWIIDHLYDARYAQAGPMLQWLSFGLVFARYGLAQSAYVALGHAQYGAAINLVRTLSLFTLVPLLYWCYGISGAIVGVAFHLTPIWFCVFWFNRRHRLNNFVMELVLLGAWPAGWLAGFAVTILV